MAQLTNDQFAMLEDGLLVHFHPNHRKNGEVLVRWVTPRALVPLVLRMGHDDASAAHAGVGTTRNRIMAWYFWPGMALDIRTYVLSCTACQVRRRATTTLAPTQTPLPRPLWELLHMDLWKAGVASTCGKTQVLVIVEARTGYVWLRAMEGATAAEIALHLYEVLLDVGALPREIISDRGGDIVTHLCAAFAVRKFETTAYRPKANGKVEGVNPRMAEVLTKWVNQKQTDWPTYLSTVQFALRTAPRADTGLTPFFCVFGREATLPLDACGAGSRQRSMDLHEDIEHRIQAIKLAADKVDEVYNLKRAATERRNSRILRQVRVAPGDHVMLLRRPSEGRSKKLDNRYTGPWKVLHAAGPSGVSYVCRMAGRSIRYRRVGLEDMKLFHSRPEGLTTQAVHALLTYENAELLDCSQKMESIVDRRSLLGGAGWQYQVRDRDGHQSPWLNEDEMLQRVNPWTLDTFHALYEMRHGAAMPYYAARPAPPPKHRPDRAEALQEFPRGTRVVRQAGRDGEAPAYVGGQVSGYYHPWWCVLYDDDLWEDMTRTQLRAAVALTHVVALRKRCATGTPAATSPADEAEPKEAQPTDDVGSASPAITKDSPLYPLQPMDLGQTYEGCWMRMKFGTGWARAQLRTYHSERPKHTFTVTFVKEAEGKTIKLREGYYSTDREARVGSWHILVPQDVPPAGDAAALDRSPSKRRTPGESGGD